MACGACAKKAKARMEAMAASSGEPKPKRKVMYNVVAMNKEVISSHESNYEARVAARGHRGARVGMVLVDVVE